MSKQAKATEKRENDDDSFRYAKDAREFRYPRASLWSTTKFYTLSERKFNISKRHLRTLAIKGEMCAKATNSLGTRTKVQAFQVTSTGLIPRFYIASRCWYSSTDGWQVCLIYATANLVDGAGLGNKKNKCPPLFRAEKCTEHAWTFLPWSPGRVWKNGGISNILLPKNKMFPLITWKEQAICLQKLQAVVITLSLLNFLE